MDSILLVYENGKSKIKKKLKITSTQKNPEKELSILNHVFKDNLNHLKNVESLKL